MKKLLSFAIIALFATSVFAQQEVTKFLGIPIDGTKSAMIEKLKAKGFTWNARMECLEGEFNGEDVYVKVATNNNKVWRIGLMDKNLRNETDIRIRFNLLVNQFERNAKYKKFRNDEDFIIQDSERIGENIWLYHKRYRAAYIQNARFKDFENMTDEEAEKLSEKEIEQQFRSLIDSALCNQVWFMIEREGYEKFKILMFYDNERNHANGEDL